MRRGSSLAGVLAGAGLLTPVAAAGETVICQNPGREYLVVYSEGDEALVLMPETENTRLRILIDEKTDTSHVVTFETAQGGPTGRLHLRPYQKIEYWAGGEVIQTDGCYRSQ